jgi:O-methyltransferase involved in polyketide biosynthesis
MAIGSPPGRLMTNAEKSQLSGVKQTLLYTLYYRALDQRSKAPIVGDTWAAEVLGRITADNRKGLLTAKLGASGRFPPLLRARRLDDWTREFLARHPDASVLHVGCGLEAAPSALTCRSQSSGTTWISPTSSSSVAASVNYLPVAPRAPA